MIAVTLYLHVYIQNENDDFGKFLMTRDCPYAARAQIFVTRYCFNQALKRYTNLNILLCDIASHAYTARWPRG